MKGSEEYVNKNNAAISALIGKHADKPYNQPLINEMTELLAKAGYAFSDSDKTDLVVEYFLKNRHYNVIDINLALYKHGLPEL